MKNTEIICTKGIYRGSNLYCLEGDILEIQTTRNGSLYLTPITGYAADRGIIEFKTNAKEIVEHFTSINN